MSTILRSLPLFKSFQQSHFCENLPTLMFNSMLGNADETDQLYGSITLPFLDIESVKNNVDPEPLTLKLPEPRQYHAFLAPQAFHFEDIACEHHQSDLGYSFIFGDEGAGEIEEEIYKGVLYTAKQQTPYGFLAFSLKSMQFDNEIALVLMLDKLHVTPSDQHPDDWVHLTAILCHFMDIVLEGITLQTTKESELNVSLRADSQIPNKVIQAINAEVNFTLQHLQSAYPHGAQQSGHVMLELDHDL